MKISQLGSLRGRLLLLYLLEMGLGDGVSIPSSSPNTHLPTLPEGAFSYKLVLP